MRYGIDCEIPSGLSLSDRWVLFRHNISEFVVILRRLLFVFKEESRSGTLLDLL